ncbi:MAG: 4-alpha-glucanotransferase, partial [Chlamydiae bacterium]|nr:4-alpha-glucanotransferase [Chlamydiota bacterium]
MSLQSHISNTPLAKQWSLIGLRHHHGIALPLGALHTHNSSGIGEYLDLIPLINFCSDVGLDVIQLLPLNDSGDDPSPYNALSSKALHPIYLSLHALPFQGKYPELADTLQAFKPLNKTLRVEYHTV